MVLVDMKEIEVQDFCQKPNSIIIRFKLPLSIFIMPIKLKSSLLIWFAVTSSWVKADLRLDGGDEFGWDTEAWRVQVDGVMGGKSSGDLRFDDSDTIMSFSGDIVLDGGGFSSLRRRFSGPIDLSEYAGVVVELESVDSYNEADIQPPLGLHLQLHDTPSRYGFASAFAIPLTDSIGEKTSVYLPIESFDRGSRSGFQCSNCQLNISSVNEMDIYVLFQDGSFQVRIKSITAVDTPQSFPSPAIFLPSSIAIKELLDSTIESGGKLYDYSYGELCVAVYRSTLNTLLAASGDEITDVVRGMVCEGLLRAETFDNIPDIAWTLRYTMDGILEQLEYSDPEEGEGWRPNVDDADSFALQCSAVTSVSLVIEDAFLPLEPTISPTTEVTLLTTTMSTSQPSSSSTNTPTYDLAKMRSPHPTPTQPFSASTTLLGQKSQIGDVGSSSSRYPDSMVSSSGNNGGVRVGVVVGVILLILVCAFASIFCWKRCSRKSANGKDHTAAGMKETPMDVDSSASGNDSSQQPSSTQSEELGSSSQNEML